MQKVETTLLLPVSVMTLFSEDGDDLIVALDGNNSVVSGFGDDQVFTGAGSDTVFAAGGDNVIVTDTVLGVSQGTDLGDSVVTGDGDDFINVGASSDTVRSGAGDDLVIEGFVDGGVTQLDGDANFIFLEEGDDELVDTLITFSPTM